LSLPLLEDKMQDKEIKMEAAKFLWRLGYDTELEAIIIDPKQVGSTIYNITDIDVIGIKLSEDLRIHKLLIDCKKLGKVSPVNRLFWLKGIMDHMECFAGYIILDKPIVSDHKILASKYNISLLEYKDLDILKSKLIKDNSNFDSNIFSYSSYEGFLKRANEIKEISDLREYIERFYWNEDPAQQIRHILQHTRFVGKNITQKNKIISAYLLYSLIKFYNALASMISKLFHIYLTKDSKEELDENLKVFLYGGRENYDYFNKLYSGLVNVKRSVQKERSLFEREEDEQLSLPEWDSFLQLYKAMIESVSDISQIGRFYRYLLYDVILEDRKLDILRTVPSYTNKTGVIASQILSYFQAACALPTSACDPIETAVKRYL